MNADTSLLLHTVLSERGCVDATLQRTADTAPFVYRVLAEQAFFLIHAVSVVKALLHEKDAAFAHLARWQALRETSPSGTTNATSRSNTNTTAPVGLSLLRQQLASDTAAPPGLPPVGPSDSLDLAVTIIGGGTGGELLLRLLCDEHASPSPATVPTSTTAALAASLPPIATRHLVHPSHIFVVTRQPDRLAAYAQRGVHCLTRHHGAPAVRQSDVVVLACPPALFREVTHDLCAPSSLAASAAETTRPPRGGAAAAAPTATAEAPPSPLLMPTAVLLSCMAGVPARKVAVAFGRPVELAIVPRLRTADGLRSSGGIDDCGGGGGGVSVSGIGSDESSLQHVAADFAVAAEAYRTARMAEMRSHISFLRPAVLEHRELGKARAAVAISDAIASARAAAHGGLKMPHFTDFTAGRRPATAHTLDGFLDVWRVLRSHVQATFAEAMQRAAKRGHRGLQPSSGLICVVLPESSRLPQRSPGEVEAALLPALALLPPHRTVELWKAWWQGAVYGRAQASDAAAGAVQEEEEEAGGASPLSGLEGSAVLVGRGVQQQQGQQLTTMTTSRLSSGVTRLTGEWLGLVYASDAALLADLELQYHRVLERQPPRLH